MHGASRTRTLECVSSSRPCVSRIPPVTAFSAVSTVPRLLPVSPPHLACSPYLSLSLGAPSRHALLSPPRVGVLPPACASSYGNGTPQRLPTGAAASARAQRAFGAFARRKKSWTRLRYLVDLALAGPSLNMTAHVEGIAGLEGWSLVDIGCDHGLLAFAFAVTGQFSSVLGVDISESALRAGGLKLVDNVAMLPSASNSISAWLSTQRLNLEFRLGDGLRALQRGEADVICIAGMGCKTMLDILVAENCDGELLLSALESKRLVLQPASARPRDLMELYDVLRSLGWIVTDERIVFLSARWYVTVAFERQALRGCEYDVVPGEKLIKAAEEDEELGRMLGDWVQLHSDWIRSDVRNTGAICVEEKRWLELFDHFSCRPLK